MALWATFDDENGNCIYIHTETVIALRVFEDAVTFNPPQIMTRVYLQGGQTIIVCGDASRKLQISSY